MFSATALSIPRLVIVTQLSFMYQWLLLLKVALTKSELSMKLFFWFTCNDPHLIDIFRLPTGFTFSSLPAIMTIDLAPVTLFVDTKTVSGFSG